MDHENKAARRVRVLGALSAAVATAVCAADTAGVAATLQVASGPHAGKYTYEGTDACIIAASEPATPTGFSVIVMSDRSQLSIDLPNVDNAHVNELQIELVIADVKPNQSRKNTATTTYTIDTRPDASLAQYQRDERGGKGTSGTATAQLSQNGNTARLSFNAQTAEGVKIDGTIDCRKVDREFGR